MTTTVEIDDALPLDLRLLALSVLKGDQSAVMPLLDCMMENAKGATRVTPAYVEMLEDYLLEVRRFFASALADTPRHYSLTMCDVDVIYRLKDDYFKLERVAHSLNRTGLS